MKSVAPTSNAIAEHKSKCIPNQKWVLTHGKLTFALIPIDIAYTPHLICGTLTMSVFRFYCLWCYDLIGSKTLDSVSYCRANLNKSRSRVECNCRPETWMRLTVRQKRKRKSISCSSKYICFLTAHAGLLPTLLAEFNTSSYLCSFVPSGWLA